MSADVTPIQDAARGVRSHERDGVLIADDADAMRIARAVAEHRAALMDRLGR